MAHSAKMSTCYLLCQPMAPNKQSQEARTCNHPPRPALWILVHFLRITWRYLTGISKKAPQSYHKCRSLLQCKSSKWQTKMARGFVNIIWTQTSRSPPKESLRWQQQSLKGCIVRHLVSQRHLNGGKRTKPYKVSVQPNRRKLTSSMLRGPQTYNSQLQVIETPFKFLEGRPPQSKR